MSDNLSQVNPEMIEMDVQTFWRIIFECCGAATGVMMRDMPHYEFPADRVSDAVRAVMLEFGFSPPQGYSA